MEFRKWKRTAEILPMRMWRLASVDEVRNNMETIKNEKILDSWEIARLLDGWMAGPGYRYPIKEEYKSNMEHMLLVKTSKSRRCDGSFSEEMFSGVELNSEGRKAALLLSCDDKITEVMCFVLKNIVDRFQDHGERQEELDHFTESLMNTFSHCRPVFHYAADQPNGKHAEYLAELILKKFEYGKEMIKAADKYGRTALHYAALHGHFNLCTFLMDKCELKAKEKDKNGENLLHFVLTRGNAHIAYILLESTSVRNLFYFEDAMGKTLLHKAAVIGNLDTLCTLLDERMPIMYERDTLLDERVSLLHQRVSDLDQRVSDLDQKVSVLDTLLDEKSSVLAALLNKQVCLLDTRMEERVNQIMEEHKERVTKAIRQADFFGQTALLEAARQGHYDAVWYLLRKGSRPLLERNSEGKTALHYSVQLADKKVAIRMARLLVQHYRGQERLLLLCASAIGMGTAEQSAESSPEVQAYLEEQRNHTTGISNDLLVNAIKLGYEKLAWELVDRGANTSQIDNLIERDLTKKEQKRVEKFRTDLKHKDEREKKMQEIGRDQPTILDSLGRMAFAEGLAALFLNPNVKSPVTVGISGEWGMGKSSLMLQTEMILLQARAQLAFPNFLPFQDFPGSTRFDLTEKAREKYNKLKNGVKDLLPGTGTDKIDDPLVYFLDNYQDKYPQVYKSLALMDCSEMFRSKDMKKSDSSCNLGMVPSILTVRYNAWHYQNELEAWAGLAVTITKAMEETMAMSQRIRSRCKYAWKERRGDILLQFLLPFLLALFLSGWGTWAVWLLLKRSKHSDLEDLIYGSIPVTLVTIFWTVMRQSHSVLQSVSGQIMEYIRLPEHDRNMGYQHQVISDINFLKKEICEKPSLFWKFLAGNWLWRMSGLYLDTVEGTSIPKIPPPSKDDIRIIVFVDDLDRCEYTVILQVLCAINLVLAVCEINVILGMDKKMIARAIAHKYQRQDKDISNMVDSEDLAEKYLSKIVQLPLALPDFDNDERTRFLKQLLREEYKESEDDERDGSSQHPLGVQPNDSEDPPQNPGQLSIGAEFNDIENPPQNSPSSQFSSGAQPIDTGNLPQNFGSSQPSPGGQPNSLQISRISQPSPGNPPQRGLKSWAIISQLFNCFTALSWFRGCCSGPDISSSKLKSMAVNIELIMPSYSKEELTLMTFLSQQGTHGLQIPREWKRFLTYHRLAWNILFRMKQVNLPGCRGQLLVWIFCCWQWKDNINLIIENWKELMRSLNDNDPSFKIIVEHCINKKVNSADRGKWQLLNKILDKYDVSMESIQSFQKFRLHCEAGYLPPPSEIATELMNNTSA